MLGMYHLWMMRIGLLYRQLTIVSRGLFVSGARHTLEMSRVDVQEFEEFGTLWDVVAIVVKLRLL